MSITLNGNVTANIYEKQNTNATSSTNKNDIISNTKEQYIKNKHT